MTNILLADDHAMFREGVALLLKREGLNIVGEASDGVEAVGLAKKLGPDVIVLDLSMPELNGIEAAREIRRDNPGAKMVLLTMYEEDSYMLEALRAGFSGFVTKSQTEPDLVHTIREVAAGALYLGPNISQEVIDALVNKTRLNSQSLSERELQVVELIAEGKTTRDIAKCLGLSPKTIESHRSRIMHKLDFHQAAELVCFAVRMQMNKSLVNH